MGLFVGVSGFCSLVYQVVWDRTLKCNFGGDTTSSAVVTATFLLGLGLGAVGFGRWRRRAFVTYALVEIGIGLYGICSFGLLSRVATVLGRAFDYSMADASGLRSIVVVACMLFLLPPCFLMGGTLPLMFNAFVSPGTYKNRTVGLIYGLNTAGASVGIVAVPLLFLNRLSIPATLLVAGLANIGLGMAVWLCGALVGVRSPDVPAAEPNLAKRDEAAPLAPMALSFCSGFITLSFEIVLFRTASVLKPMSPYVFPMVLAPFLLALAAGSVVFTRFRQYTRSTALNRVGLLFVLASASMLAGLPARYLMGAEPFSLRALFRGSPGLFGYLAMVAPAPFLLGGVFPLLLRLASDTGRGLPARTGRLYVASAVGSFIGAMLVQFVGFSFVGTRGVVSLLSVLGIAAGLGCLVAGRFRRMRSALVGSVALGCVLIFMPRAAWEVYTFGETGGNRDLVEGATGVATVDWSETDGAPAAVRVNGQYMSGLPDHPKHIRLAALALALPRRNDVAVLGLGGGGMVRELAKDAGVARIDVVDWSHELPVLLRKPRPSAALDNVLSSPKVRLLQCDARVAASLCEGGEYDLVIDNLAMIGWVGSTSIKSVQYFREVARVLNPTGVFVFDANYSGPAARKAVLSGLTRCFPHVVEHNSEWPMPLASARPIVFDPARVRDVMAGRGAALGCPRPYAEWILSNLAPVAPGDFASVPPIVDELLIFEYTFMRGGAGNRPRGNADLP